MKKILVTGASGLLGSKLVHVLSSGHKVIPTHSTDSYGPSSLRMDITKKSSVMKVFKSVRPDVTVHAAAMTNVDKCETNKELAWNINALGTRNIAEACSMNGARLIYISTDYVFDGDRGFYKEDDKTNPVNYYGFTKLKGEEFVREQCGNWIIARTSVLYGWHPRKNNFATWVVDSLRKRRTIKVADDHYNSPTLADDLAKIIRRLLENELSGVYHTSGGERASRFDFAVKMAETFELDTSMIIPVKMREIEAWIAERPRDSSLCIEKLRTNLGIEPLDLAQAFKEFKFLEVKGGLPPI